MKKISIKVSVLSLTFLPLIAFAETKDLRYLINLASGYLKDAMYFILALAVVMFVWNVFNYFIYSDDVSKKKEAGLYVMWSIIGFFVILSVWGLVNIVRNTFKLDDNAPSSGLFGTFAPGGGNSIFNSPAKTSNQPNQSNTVNQPSSTPWNEVRDNPYRQF
ncbi:MAG: pilin [Patescibacteria group bacterium]